MSKERARRRAEREREEAIKAAARAAEAGAPPAPRRPAPCGHRLGPAAAPAARPARGPAAPPGRPRPWAILVVLNVAGLGGHARTTAARALGVMVSLLAAPVLYVMLFGRR